MKELITVHFVHLNCRECDGFFAVDYVDLTSQERFRYSIKTLVENHNYIKHRLKDADYKGNFAARLEWRAAPTQLTSSSSGPGSTDLLAKEGISFDNQIQILRNQIPFGADVRIFFWSSQNLAHISSIPLFETAVGGTWEPIFDT